jgi:hypothetical protein
MILLALPFLTAALNSLFGIFTVISMRMGIPSLSVIKIV